MIVGSVAEFGITDEVLFFLYNVDEYDFPILQQVGQIRQHLAEVYENEENWKEAANILVNIPIESGQKQYDLDYKVRRLLPQCFKCQ